MLEVDRDDHLHVSLVKVLMQTGDRAALPAALLDSNSLEVRSAVVEYRRVKNDKQVVKELRGRIGGSDGFNVGPLGRISLDQATLRSLSVLLQGSVEERRQAACVIAMQADEATVMKLLIDPDSRIRGEAADCVPFNSNSLAKTLPKALTTR